MYLEDTCYFLHNWIALLKQIKQRTSSKKS